MSEKKQTAENPVTAGKKGPGRPKGVPNKTTTQLKEAILLAGEAAGNKLGQQGLVSYLEFLAQDNSSAFASLLGKVLPMQVQHSGGMEITNTTKEQRDAAVAAATRADT